MNFFTYKDGHIRAEDVPLSRIAEAAGTPVYVYSAATLTRHFKAFEAAAAGMDHLIAYSVKANSSLAVLRLLGGLGAGADVVSGGELVRAMRAGIAPEKIVFSGVGKSMDEMRAALEAGIFQFNVESVPELRVLNAVAADLKKSAPVALRINPDVAAGGHEKITTGKAENKFGIDLGQAKDVYRLMRDLDHVQVRGVDMHIGSQIDHLAPFETALGKLLDLIKDLRAAGHEIRTLDVGGGLGIAYADEDAPPLPLAYGAMIDGKTRGRELKIIFEPGRAIAGNAGVLLSRVRYVKSGGARNFLILDAAMNDLIRPALYGARHQIEPVLEPADSTKREEYDVVGPVCETGDTFARFFPLPSMQAGDLVIVRSAGAYGAVQACEYNTRPLVPEVLVSGDQYAVIRKRPSLDEMLAREDVPEWV